MYNIKQVAFARGYMHKAASDVPSELSEDDVANNAMMMGGAGAMLGGTAGAGLGAAGGGLHHALTADEDKRKLKDYLKALVVPTVVGGAGGALSGGALGAGISLPLSLLGSVAKANR